MTISLAPLQGYTDFVFRNAIHQHMGGIDKFYSPYLRLQNDNTLKKSQIADISPENNKTDLIPQIICNSSESMLWFDNYLADLGYTEMNWNLGCPYPMVAKRKLGSGLLSYPEQIDSILSECLSTAKLKLSIKLRLGYENPDDIYKIIDITNQYQLQEIILHPRIGKELYKNTANKSAFTKCNELSNYKLAYNGDINSIEDANNLIASNKQIEHIMIGRGLLSNPFLAKEIKQKHNISDDEKREQFLNFYAQLYTHYQHSLSGDSHQVNKLFHLWEYFSQLFENSKKAYKRLKKTKKIDQFIMESTSIIRNEEFA